MLNPATIWLLRFGRKGQGLGAFTSACSGSFHEQFRILPEGCWNVSGLGWNGVVVGGLGLSTERIKLGKPKPKRLPRRFRKANAAIAVNKSSTVTRWLGQERGPSQSCSKTVSSTDQDLQSCRSESSMCWIIRATYGAWGKLPEHEQLLYPEQMCMQDKGCWSRCHLCGLCSAWKLLYVHIREGRTSS